MSHRRCLMAIICTLAVGVSNHGFSVEAAPSGVNACQGGYSSHFVLTGEVNKRAIYDEESLGRLPHSIENVTFLTKTGPQSSSFSGVLLWNLLTNAGIKTSQTETASSSMYR